MSKDTEADTHTHIHTYTHTHTHTARDARARKESYAVLYSAGMRITVYRFHVALGIALMHAKKHVWSSLGGAFVTCDKIDM